MEGKGIMKRASNLWKALKVCMRFLLAMVGCSLSTAGLMSWPWPLLGRCCSAN